MIRYLGIHAVKSAGVWNVPASNKSFSTLAEAIREISKSRGRE